MEFHKISELLDKYLNGFTSPAEEKVLSNYFSQDNLPLEHQTLKEMFTYFEDAKNESNPDFNISQELEGMLENEWRKNTKRRFYLFIKFASSAAAIILLIFGIYHYNSEDDLAYQDTYTDTEKAYQETKQVLLYISNSLNKNTSGLKHLSKIDNSFKQINKLSEVNKSINSLKSKKK